MFKSIKDLFVLDVQAARTTASDPLQKFMFRVTINGMPSSIGFQKVSGLSKEMGVVEYREGGYDYAHKLSGRPKVGEVTMERGAFADRSLEELWKKTLMDSSARNTIIIEMLDRQGNVSRTYKLAEAWVSKWEGSDLDATSDDVAIEKITVQHEYFLD